MSFYNDWSRIFRNDNAHCLCWCSSSFIFICCNDVKCCSTKKSMVFIRVKFKTYSNWYNYKHRYFFELIIVIGGWKYKPELLNSNNFNTLSEITNTHSLGQILYTDYIHVFQISGMILLIAMIGAIVLTFRQREGVKKQSYIKQISRERSDGVEVLEVSSRKGVKVDD